MAKPEAIPVLHVVTDDEVVTRPVFLEQTLRVMEAGGPNVALHLRARGMSARRMCELVAALKNRAMDPGIRLVVNDRVDVALAAGVDGAQVGVRGLSVADARRVLGADFLLGASVHSVGEARAAGADGADYVIAGTIWETASHPGRSGAGVGLIRHLAELGIPTIAIGGVTPGRGAEARQAGAAGVAVLRGVWDAPDPAAAVAEYLSYWKG